MKNILFRAWDLNGNEFISPSRHFIYQLQGSGVDFDYQQYTGINDKAGTKIFEGDIIKDCLTGMVSVVKFGFCQKRAFTGWYVENEEMGYVSAINNDMGEDRNSLIEVIGTIYQDKSVIA